MPNPPACACDYPAEPEYNVSGHRDYCPVQHYIAREYNLKRWAEMLVTGDNPFVKDLE